MTEEEEWVKTAMSDDAVVVEMLLRINQAEPPPPPRKRGAAPVLLLEWSVRQRRSQQAYRKKGDTSDSPTTPLSWSGDTSVSGGRAADAGFEDSSKPIGNERSKVVAIGEPTTSKRTRKRKTLAELKEAESSLLKEGTNLKNLDVLSQQTMETIRASASQEALLNQPYQMKVLPSCMISLANGACNEVKPSSTHGSSEVQEDGSKGSSFLLPDLNLPFNNDSGFGIME